MGNRSKALLNVLTAIVLGGAAMSEAYDFATGDDLREWCEPLARCTSESGKCSRREFQKVNRCLGFISGFIGGHDMGLVEAGAEPKFVCTPDEATVGQFVRIFLKYTTDHPEDLHFQAKHVLYGALFEAFPCK